LPRVQRAQGVAVSKDEKAQRDLKFIMTYLDILVADGQANLEKVPEIYGTDFFRGVQKRTENIRDTVRARIQDEE
jgi:hypothetical protein